MQLAFPLVSLEECGVHVLGGPGRPGVGLLPPVLRHDQESLSRDDTPCAQKLVPLPERLIRPRDLLRGCEVPHDSQENLRVFRVLRRLLLHKFRGIHTFDNRPVTLQIFACQEAFCLQPVQEGTEYPMPDCHVQQLGIELDSDIPAVRLPE